MSLPANPAAETHAAARWRHWFAAGRGRWLGMIVCVVLTAAMLIADPGPLPPLRLNSFDAYQVWLPRTRVSGPAVIVAIDEESIARVGQWPWPRDTLAVLIEKISSREPAAIAVDIVFAEADRASPERLASAVETRDPLAAQHLRTMPRNDEILARAIRRSRVVLGLAGVDQSRAKGTPPASALVRGPAPPLIRYPAGLRSLPELDHSAIGHGLLNADTERGIVRRVPLVAYIGDQPILTLGLESLRVASQSPSFGIVQRAGYSEVVLDEVRLPVQPDGRAWVNFGPHDKARYVSAADILENREAPELMGSKIVLLGVTAFAFLDQQTTARGERMPGIEIHAQVVENAFEKSFLLRTTWARYPEAAAFLLAAIVLIVCVPRTRPRHSFMIVLACCVLLAGAGIGAYLGSRMLFDPATPIAGLAALYGLMLSATLVAADLDRRQLGARLAAEREAAARVTGELDAARRIQLGMLPTRESAIREEPRIEIFPYMKAAREVGGDLYDFFALPDDKFIVMIGDVSGKGLPAAMFMAVTKAIAKSCALRATGGPAALITTLNKEISRENPEQMFVTLIALVLDLRTGAVSYCNAGHELPILSRRSGETLLLNEGGGPPLCVVEDFDYEEARVKLEPRDVLTLASDGLTEAMNRSGALYGRARLQALLDSRARRDVDITILGNEILASVKTFEATAEAADDQTLVLVSWRGAAERISAR